MDVYIRGNRIQLDPSKLLGKGGEAEVFGIGGKQALKVFKTPDHPDYQGQPMEQQAAEERISLHQKKLREFPTGLPAQVIVPESLATDRSGNRLLGYAMRRLDGAVPLLRYAESSFRRAGVSARQVVDLFRGMHRTLSGLHDMGVVVGDLNDLNVLVTAGEQAWFIDTDSFQFAGYVCKVFTERFVDPRLCDPDASAPRLIHGHDTDSDWYAFAVLLVQSLLLVGPYGGVFRPKQQSDWIPNAARPLRRIWVFHQDVQYPKPAMDRRILSDGVLEHFRGIFERDHRGRFPLSFLEAMRFSSCPRCGLEYLPPACPVCCVPAQATANVVVRVRGEVVCERVFETSGFIAHASAADGELRYVYYEAGAYRREDGSAILSGDADPRLQFRAQGPSTLIGRGRELVMVTAGSVVQRQAVDIDGSGPAFGANAKHRYWIEAGRLCRDTDIGLGPGDTETVGEVLSDQTRIWVGSAFGLGLYRASLLSVAFVFDAQKRGINDSLQLPRLNGHLVDARCLLDEARAWLLLALRNKGKTEHLCLVYSRSGVLEASAEASAGDGSWLGRLGGKCATQGMLLAATDSGIDRVEVKGRTVQSMREFPDTEPFVNDDSELLVGRRGLYVVGRNRISVLQMQ